MSTTTKTKYTVAVYESGQKQFGSEGYYDRLTKAPHIVAVAATQADADAWIEKQMAQQANETRLLPGQGYHRLYSTISLATPEAYLSKQEAGRQNINIGLANLGVISDENVEKI
jgi:hypothetical protein